MSIGTHEAIPSERAASEHFPMWPAYVFAVASTVATLIARMGMGVVFAERPLLILFLLPIILSAYMGGLGPGLTATAAAAVVVDYFLIPPIHSFHLAYSHDFVQWGFLIVNGALISVLSESLHRSRRQAEMSRLQHEKSEERFRRAMEATSDGLWDWDVAGGKRLLQPRLLPNAGVRTGRIFSENRYMVGADSSGRPRTRFGCQRGLYPQ